MTEYYDLGSHTRKITTTSAAAQIWFDRGLNWCYGFNHEEAIVCFENALEHDPECAMAHWGIAYAIGPNYNKPWDKFDEKDFTESLARAWHEIAEAAERAVNCTDAAQGLIAAMKERLPENNQDHDFARRNDAYADAMRIVYRNNPDDMDVRCIFVDALMNRTPWLLWDLEAGTPCEGADTMEAIEVLEVAFRDYDAEGANRHPGLLHLYVHLMEMSPHPERALKAGDTLSYLVPDAGHLAHMATHIDVLCGHYQTVVERNSTAIVADRKYLEQAGPMNFYTGYRCHDYHFKIYGAMFLGQYQPAMEAAEEMNTTLPRELLQQGSPPMADWLESYVPIKHHVQIRFGKWEEILAEVFPDDPELYCVTTATLHYARAVAMAATGDVAGAEAVRELFLAACERVPETRMTFNNTCRSILKVAEAMLDGELYYRKGHFNSAFDHLRRSVALDDALPYEEPWGWMQPTRHALGALLLEQGHTDEAEDVYRSDLGLNGKLRRPCQHPDNIWSLHGLHECLTKRGEAAEAALIKQRLDLAMARADVEVKGSCYCRMQHAA